MAPFLLYSPGQAGESANEGVAKAYQDGATSLKGSVYILPYSEDHLEAKHWLTGEVASLGGEAAFAKVERIETTGDEEVVSLFQAQRANDARPHRRSPGGSGGSI